MLFQHLLSFFVQDVKVTLVTGVLITQNAMVHCRL